MLYRLESGPVRETNYGLKLATTVGFPSRFMEKAESVAAAFRAQEELQKGKSAARLLLKERKLVLELYEMLVQASQSAMDNGSLSSYLWRMREEFVDRMTKIDNAMRSRGAEEAGEGTGALSAEDD